MQLEPGMRVRCVDAGNRWVSGDSPRLTQGAEYRVRSVIGDTVFISDNFSTEAGWFADRFKPIFRVKAGSRRVCFDGTCVAVWHEHS